MSHTLRVLCLALAAIGFTLCNAFLHYEQGSLSYDEGDYYQAVRKGFGMNWTDADDMPISEFIGTGIRAAKGEIPRGELSAAVRAANSTAFLRHYHPPVAFYLPIVTDAVAPHLPEESRLRLGTFALMIFWILLLALLSTRYPDFYSPWFVLVPASANWVASASGFNMHILFGLAVTTAALLWYAYEKDRSRRLFKQLGLFSLALALCSVEYSLFLIGILALWNLLVLWRKGRGERLQFLRIRLVDAVWLLSFMALLWPAGVFKLGLLKSYALQAYIALFRLSEVPSSFPTFWSMVQGKWSRSPLELVVVAAALAGILWGWRELLHRGSLFVSLLLIAAIVYTQANPALNLPWYLFPVFALSFTLFLHVLSERYRLGPAREALAALLVGIAFFTVAQFVVQLPNSTYSRQVRNIIAAEPPRSIIAVQDMAPRMGAYFPGRRVRGIHPADLKAEVMADSLLMWSRNRILILPCEMQLPKKINKTARKVGEVEDLMIYAPK